MTEEEAVGRLTALVLAAEVAANAIDRVLGDRGGTAAEERDAVLAETRDTLRRAVGFALAREGEGAAAGAVPSLSTAPRWPVTTPAPQPGRVRGTPASLGATRRAGNGSGIPPRAPGGPPQTGWTETTAPASPYPVDRHHRYLALVAEELRGTAGRGAVVLWADPGRWARALGWLKAQAELEVAIANAAVRAERRRWALRGHAARSEWRAAEAAHRAWRAGRLVQAAAAEAKIRDLRGRSEEKAGAENRTG